jgi:hypothetical protein
MVLVLAVPPLLYGGLINQRYYGLGYLMPFLAFLQVDGFARAVAIRVLLPLHCAYLISGLNGVIEKNVDVTRRIEQQVAEAVRLSADGKPVYLEFLDTGVPVSWTERLLSDRLWAPGENIFIANHVYNLARLAEHLESTRETSIQVGEKKASIDLASEARLTALEVSVDPACSRKVAVPQISARWRYSDHSGRDSRKDHVFSRHPSPVAIFAMPGFTRVEVASNCIIDRISFSHGDSVKLIPSNALLADVNW